MKGSVSFYPNHVIFTQNIHEGTGRVNGHIQLKSGQNWLKYQYIYNICSVALIMAGKTLEMGQDFIVEFSYTSVISMKK